MSTDHHSMGTELDLNQGPYLYTCISLDHHVSVLHYAKENTGIR
jgi:hypothetical protein